jgi:hypothetical protein
LKQQMNNLILQGLYSEDITKLEDKKWANHKQN